MRKDAVSYRDAFPAAVAIFTVLAAVMLPQTVAAQAATCGDGVCESGESFDSCFSDCASAEAKEARALLNEARNEIQPDEEGYEELQRAMNRWVLQDFEGTKRYSEQALAVHRNNGTSPGGEVPGGVLEDVPQSWILVGIAVVVIGVSFWLYRLGKSMRLLSRDNTVRKSTRTRENDLSKRMGELVMRIGEKLEEDVDLDQDELLRKIDEAHDALDEDRHEEAVELIEEVEEKISEASDSG